MRRDLSGEFLLQAQITSAMFHLKTAYYFESYLLSEVAIVSREIT